MVFKRKLLFLWRSRTTFSRYLHTRRRIEQQACGAGHTSGYVWGAGDGGQLGRGSTDAVNALPSAFPVEQEFSHVGCGSGFTVLSVANKSQLWMSGLDVFSFHGKPAVSGQGLCSSPQVTDLPVISEETCITQIACGRSHALILTDHEGENPSRVLKSDPSGISKKNTVFAWKKSVFSIGGNSQGQCGIGLQTDQIQTFQPVPLPKEIGKVVKVVCGLDHSLLLSEEGHVYSCGWGADGQTGLGHFNDAPRVSRLTGDLVGVRVKDVESSVDCCLAVSDEGEVFSWGNSEYSQLGIITEEQQIATPRKAPLLEGLGKVAKVAAAGSNCIVLIEDGAIYTWGYGVLGHGSDVTFSKEPIRIESLMNIGELVTGVHCGLDHSAITTESGKLFVWGRGGFGRLGLGDTKDQWTPKQVDLPGSVMEVSCGVDHMGVILETRKAKR